MQNTRNDISADTSGQEERDTSVSSPLRDLAVGVFFAVFCGAGWYSLLSAKSLMSSIGAGLDPGPAFLPMLVLGLLSLGSALILIKGAYRLVRARGLAWSPWSEDSLITHLYALAALTTLAVLPVLIGWLGFLPATLLFIHPWISWLAWRRSGRPWRSLFAGLLYATVIAAFLYLVFIKALKVPLG